MSTPDQPDTPPLTRRRLREIRNTGSTPIIPLAGEEPVIETVEESAPEAVDESIRDAVEEGESAPESEPKPEADAEPEPTPAPLARAAEPAVVAPAPDPHVDLGVAPLTRRQARAQERIRTASVPIIAPDAIHAPVQAEPEPELAAPAVISEVPAGAPADVEAGLSEPVEAELVDDASGEGAAATHDEPAPDDTEQEISESAIFRPAFAEAEAPTEAEPLDEQEEEPARTVNPALGSDLLLGETPAVSLPPSFDQLIARSASATGSIATPNALILSQTPTGAPLVGPITATGEVLITGTFELPEGLGSVGHAPGTADGKDIDVALIDGELPAASSPTPIAASAAISTVRNSGEEIIRPPAPEKGSRLMLALVITAGVLALALAGVLVLAITTGRI
jgi:hypothetical protein